MPPLGEGLDWAPVLRWLASHGLRLLLILVGAWLLTLLLNRFFLRAVDLLVRRSQKGEDPAEARKRVETLSSVAVRTAGIVIGLAALLMVLSELGLDITPLLAGAGVVGLAVGFGAQSLVRDVISGLFILGEGQFAKGDVVKIASISGLVEDVNLRHTILRDLDGTVHYIPNGQISTVSNFTREWSRVNLDVEVAYKEDLDRVIAVVNRVGAELAQDATFGSLIMEAPQVLRVEALGTSGVTLKVLGVTKPIKQWEVMGELRKRIKTAFDREGIRFPSSPG